MEILIYFSTAAFGIALWVIITELGEKILDKKTDEVSRIKKTSRTPHSFEDHNTQYRQSNQTTISFWRKDKFDFNTVERMRHTIKNKMKEEANERE